MQHTEDRWLSREAVAERYGIATKTAAQWAWEGRGPKYTRIGRFARYRLSDCIAWENEQPSGHDA